MLVFIGFWISGFSTVWYDQMEKAYLIQAYVKNPQQFAKHQRKPFSVEDLQTPFFILIVGYTMSFVVFLMEKFVASPEKCEKVIGYLRPVQSIKNNFQKNRRLNCADK